MPEAITPDTLVLKHNVTVHKPRKHTTLLAGTVPPKMFLEDFKKKGFLVKYKNYIKDHPPTAENKLKALQNENAGLRSENDQLKKHIEELKATIEKLKKPNPPAKKESGK